MTLCGGAHPLINGNPGAATLGVMDEGCADAAHGVKLPALAGLHALFALSEPAASAGEALVALGPDAGSAGGVARLAPQRRLVPVEAGGALCHAGAICSRQHKAD